MKKLICLLLVLFMATTFSVGCTEQENRKDDTEAVEAAAVRLGGLKGPTTMGMVKLLDDAENGKTKNRYDYTIAVSADELTPKLLKGELDILAVPANLGAILSAKSDGAVQMLAVNTLGVLSIVEKGGNEINVLADLRGKTLYATGKGTTPEYALSYLLSQNGLTLGKDVSVVWKSEPTEIVSAMATEQHAIAMLPQPFVTVAQTKLEQLRIALDLNEIWSAQQAQGKLITAALLVRTEFAQSNPSVVKTFLEEYAASADYVNQNVADAAVLVEKYGIVQAAVAEKAIPKCNIVCITGNEMKNAASGYFAVLFEQNPSSVGGQLPNDNFYLIYD